MVMMSIGPLFLMHAASRRTAACDGHTSPHPPPTTLSATLAPITRGVCQRRNHLCSCSSTLPARNSVARYTRPPYLCALHKISLRFLPLMERGQNTTPRPRIQSISVNTKCFWSVLTVVLIDAACHFHISHDEASASRQSSLYLKLVYQLRCSRITAR